MTHPKVSPVKGSKEHIVAAIDSIRKRGAAFDKLVQDTAIDVLDHAHKHNDLDLVNRLVVAMPKGSRGQSLAIWFCKFGKLQPNTERDQRVIAVKPLVWNKDASLDRPRAAATMWYSVVKDKPLVDVFDIEAKFASFMKQVTANRDKVTNPILLAALQNVQGVVNVAYAAPEESLDLIGPHAVKQ